ncbi:MAG: cupin-like domain-containing protein [Scytonematopsis contorta HA4267-MV1]|jgi:lysine-specific demethylase 8|nr:cupin-like domain-containing protein [Scytonematopsis contorta HA4267-MV1]
MIKTVATNGLFGKGTLPANNTQPKRIPLPILKQANWGLFQRQYVIPMQPVILKGAATSWTAVKSWTPKYFATKYKDVQITPKVNLPDTEVPYVYKDKNYSQKMTIGEFVELMQSGNRCYFDQANMNCFEDLHNDYNFNKLGAWDVHVTNLWVGASTCSGLHYDWCDNLLVQIHGTKKAVLVSPEDSSNLYPFADNHTKSQVSCENPDIKAHPQVKNVTFMDGFLEPGDVLFIPKGWWHYLKSSESSITLTCWYGIVQTPMDQFKTIVRMGRPSIWFAFVRDFLWHGVLQRPIEYRLYGQITTGQMAYELLTSFLQFWRR